MTALDRIASGAPEVIEAAWQNLPSPYDIDIEDHDAMMKMLAAIVQAARNHTAQTTP